MIHDFRMKLLAIGCSLLSLFLAVYWLTKPKPTPSDFSLTGYGKPTPSDFSLAKACTQTLDSAADSIQLARQCADIPLIEHLRRALEEDQSSMVLTDFTCNLGGRLHWNRRPKSQAQIAALVVKGTLSRAAAERIHCCLEINNLRSSKHPIHPFLQAQSVTLSPPNLSEREQRELLFQTARRWRLYGIKQLPDFVLIHVGKCAGGSVRKTLEESCYIFSATHIEKPYFLGRKYGVSKGRKYVLMVRNPVLRFIAAWNYMWVLRHDDGYLRSGKNQIRFGNVNTFCEHLYYPNGTLSYDKDRDYVHHIEERLSWYYTDFLKHVHQEDILGVLVTETLDQDMQRIFGIDTTNTERQHSSPHTNAGLSEIGLSNLQKFLREDFEVIRHLHKMGHIDDTQLELLLRYESGSM